MPNVYCGFCGKVSCDVEKMLSVNTSTICNECVTFFANKIGIVPPLGTVAGRDDIRVDERLEHTFTHTIELEGYIDQKYDVFMFQCLLDMFRSENWDVSVELARVTRSDGFVRRKTALGGTRYIVDLLIRSNEPCNPQALKCALEDHWARLTSANSRLLHDKGTRDLIEVRLASLATYIIKWADAAPDIDLRTKH